MTLTERLALKKPAARRIQPVAAVPLFLAALTALTQGAETPEVTRAVTFTNLAPSKFAGEARLLIFAPAIPIVFINALFLDG